MRTARLVLRRLEAGDLDVIVELHADPVIMRLVGTGRPLQREQVVGVDFPNLLASRTNPGPAGFWGAQEATTGDLLGWFALDPDPADPGRVELGYRLRRSAWGRGLATEGARLLVGSARADPGIHTVWATTMTVNDRSRRVLEKSGLRLIRTWFGEWADPIEGAEFGDVDYEVDVGGPDPG